MNIRKSLVTKYLLLILISMLMWPILPALYYLPGILIQQHAIHEPSALETMWEEAAAQLKVADAQAIHVKLGQIQQQYPEAGMFWVDHAGNAHTLDQRVADLPDSWTPASLIRYLAGKEQEDMFTATAAIGEEGERGFMVFHIPKSHTTLAIDPANGNFYLNLIIIAAGLFLVVLSLLFFLSIRKRLVRLRLAMSDTGNDGIPNEVIVNNSDEIGQLEKAFNRMVNQLESSRAREKEEESLRKQWIANLSHDLRTPLTVMQQHAYTIQRDPSSPKAVKSIQILIAKLDDVAKLLENLLTYTLLSAGKHPINRERIDVIEELHRAAVEWYPVLEKEGLQVEIDLPDQVLYWEVDPLWLRCILDNLVQNVIRYAKSGRYIGMGAVERGGKLCLFLEDKGEGIKQETKTKGAGIGLSIVSLMTKEMDIDWETSSSPAGTIHYLSRHLNQI